MSSSRSGSGSGMLSPSRRRTRSTAQTLSSQPEAPVQQEEQVPSQNQDLPSWFEKFRVTFMAAAAHCFLLYGEVHDVMSNGLRFLDFLYQTLHSEERPIILSFHRDTGFTFPLDSMRDMAIELLGPDWSPPADDTDPYASALDAVMGQPGDAFSSSRKPAQAMALIEHLMRLPVERVRGKLAIIIDGVDLICPPTEKAAMSEQRLSLLAKLRHWGMDKQFMLRDNPIIFVTSHLDEVHPDLRSSASGIKVINVPLPDEQTRLKYVTWYLGEHRKSNPIPLVDLTPQDLARNTAGLSLRQIEDILLRGALLALDERRDGAFPGGVSRLLVKVGKDEIIRELYGETIVFLDPLPGGFEALGGMTQLKRWMREEVLLPLQQGRLQDVPKGILLPGPPGVGKTLFVEAAATEFGYNAIALRMASILNSFVGTSERNLQELFDIARRMAPTFLFIDEIDQTSLSQRDSGQSGTMVAANLFGSLLQFMSDETLRGLVIFLAATNHPENLDPALIRPGRFEVTYPVLCPDEEERQSVLAVQARLQGVVLHENACVVLAAATHQYSPADLGAVVKEAKYLAQRGGSPIVQEAHAQEALNNIRPTSLSTVQRYTERALAACNNLRFLPQSVAERERARRAHEWQAAQQRSEAPDGESISSPRMPRSL